MDNSDEVAKEKIKLFVGVPVAGAATDAVAAGVTTMVVGSMVGGPVGTFAGAAAGTAILGVSKALGYCNYKPLMKAIEDLPEEEQNDLYERMGEEVKKFETGKKYSENQFKDPAVMNAAIMEYKKTIEKNPEAMGIFTNVVNDTFAKKKMILDETE
ncbi:hypothetical protein DAPPUDRAFT_237661 [Daphnia pulex]|uniref:Uncharacterized protein n=1 Tax=Daphnia pulex TaxID=6669 RepID=E9G5I4_DAPPU|nr:hypothetical protein DAPPUDRAFT_237661 [Daphnia pulex]|eukprot:EFX85214.1 hypothetical protein DAPPUDRAFT_237661 [Daphnia pulex]